MKITQFLCTLIILLVFNQVNAHAPDTSWTKIYGGVFDDHCRSVQQTTDGGYIVLGSTFSFGAGGCDFWLIKTNSSGDTLWTKTYGGAGYDFSYSVQQTTDGGYIIVGSTDSYGAVYRDIWLVRTDSSGDTLWTKTYGGSNYDVGNSIQQIDDGGYIILGTTNSFGTGYYDIWLIKTNSSGDTLWTKTYGGPNYDEGNSIQQIDDGGYIILGTTNSFGTGNYDIWLIKTNSSGDTLWTKTYGGSSYTEYRSIQQIDDGGYIIVASTDYFGAGNYDIWLLRTDSAGDTLWTKTYGGVRYDLGYSVQQTTDGGYIIVGSTNSYGAGHYDIWLIRTDSSGDTLWTKTYGGISNDFGYSVQQTTDGGYIIGAEIQTNSADTANVYLIKLSPESGIEEYPNNIVRNRQIVTTFFTGPLVLPEDRECKVFDIFGRQVLSEEISTGIYFIEIEGKINWKVVKIR